ncbi:MAG TPA: nitrate/nitrite transporter NrtS [Ktedonosporobacter sp.]|nr:nitrate/nitrite transporter NrtS [Ktedonosporobacter sp.]
MKTLPDHTQSAHTSTSSLLSYCRERDTLLRSARMALVVGTILALINHGPALIAGRFTPEQLLPTLITYLVPFTVSLYSQIQGKRQRDLARASQ